MSSVPSNVVLNRKRAISNRRRRTDSSGDRIPFKIRKGSSDRDEPTKDEGGPGNLLNDDQADNSQPDMRNGSTQMALAEVAIPEKITKKQPDHDDAASENETGSANGAGRNTSEDHPQKSSFQIEGYREILDMESAEDRVGGFASQAYYEKDFSDDSSYDPNMDEDKSISDDDEYELEPILDDDYHDDPEKFWIEKEAIDEQTRNIDTGDFEIMQDLIIPWMIKRNSIMNNVELGLEMIFPGSMFTVKELATDVQSFLDSNGGNNKIARKTLEEDLMCNILLKFLPKDAILPMSFAMRGKKLHYHSTLNNYCGPNAFRNRTRWIDICCGSNNCVAYVGKHQDAIKCPTCLFPRYHKCTRPKCAQLAYEQCDCDYTNSGRIPHKRQPYRSIIQLFIQLLETDSFVQFCNTLMAVPEMADMVDIKHGATYTKHMKECMERFEAWKLEDLEARHDVINVNLMLSLFYDGIKVYNWKHSTFMPLIISILNLPPTYRCKFGVGQFILGLLTVSQGNAGETVLFHCLIEELLILNKGIEIVTKTKRKYFLCVRLIQYLLDTPAASKFFNYEGHNSLNGCVYCGRISGKHVKDLNKTVFIGHRFLLPLDHYLRIFGQTGTCCPKNFFPSRLVNRDNTLRPDNDREHSVQVESLNFFGNDEADLNPNNAVVQLTQSILRKTGLCINSELHLTNVENFVLDQSANKIFRWNSDIDKLLFNNYAYFLACDLRPQCKPFNSTRRFEEYRQLCARATHEGNSIQGVKGFPIFSRLPYFNFPEQFCPVNCHVISNNMKEYFQNVKGLNDNAKSKMCCTNTKSFPWLYRKNGKEDTGEIPWNLTKANREKMDAHINCIIVPLGYSQDFQISNPFQQTDVLNMKGKVHVGTTLMELIVHWSRRPFDIAYKAYYLMFSKSLVQLSRKKWANDERIEKLIELEKQIDANASIHEGIFPLALQNFVNHQMVDLTFGIRLFGNLSGFYSFALERAGGIFKRWLKKGGVATEIGIMDKYDHFENQSIDAMYSQNIPSLFNTQSRKKEQVFTAINQRSMIDNLDPHQLHFTDQRICLHKCMEKTEHNLSYPEVYTFLEDSYKYIIAKNRIQGNDDRKPGYDSALCRVFYSYYSCRKTKKMQNLKFQEYFDKICGLIHKKDPNGELQEIYQLGRSGYWFESNEYIRADFQDIELMAKFIYYLKHQLKYYQRADVYGSTFESRKIKNANELKHNWNSTDNISSWVKYIDYSNDDTTSNTSFGRRAYNSTDRYMNINFFFRIDFPQEIHLHGLAFANGTSRNSFKTKCIAAYEWRKPSQSNCSSTSSSSSSSSSVSDEASIQAPSDNYEINYLEHILVGNERRSLHQQSIFIPCVYFYATKVMIIPYHVDGFLFPDSSDANSLRRSILNAKPLLLGKKSVEVPLEFQKYYATCSPCDIHFITMIDMHPSKCLDYSYNELLLAGTTQFIARYLNNKNLDYN